jgi:hypothetical protein
MCWPSGKDNKWTASSVLFRFEMIIFASCDNLTCFAAQTASGRYFAGAKDIKT